MRVIPARLTRHEGTLLSYQGPGPYFGKAITRGHERTGTDITVKMRRTRGQVQAEIARPAAFDRSVFR
jgi:hypothetical protein